jgi:hypothetical protein
MSYENFHHKVVIKYQVDILGWPFSDMKNPSRLTRDELKSLLVGLQSTPPAVVFIRLTDDEVKERSETRQSMVARRSKDKAPSAPSTEHQRRPASSTATATAASRPITTAPIPDVSAAAQAPTSAANVESFRRHQCPGCTQREE